MAAVDRGSNEPAFAVTEGLAGDARFEIGSITKTTTAALLASLAGDGALALDDQLGRWLDAGPNANITLEQLATHTSGLPRLAPNQPADEANPYRDFTAGLAEEGLRTVSAANSVVYGGSVATTGTNMYALDAATGKILWSFASGGSVTGGAAIVGGGVYLGSGYCGTLCLGGTTPVLNNDKLYAFGLR